jgi:hypothetical protein
MDALFEQAGIKVQNEQDYSTLKSAVERLLGSAQLEKFLKKLESKSIRIREWEKVLEKRVIEDRAARHRPGTNARVLPDADRGSGSRDTTEVSQDLQLLLRHGNHGERKV